MSHTTTALRQDERSWWLRVPLVLTSPSRVFAALRDDSDPAAEARQEPLAAVVVLAGIAGVLATTVADRLYDDPEFDALVLLVWAVAAGAIHGLAGYFGVGALVYLGASFAGGLGSYRRARHVVGFAAVPVALSLVLLPVRVALYGEDAFRSGGPDTGAGGEVLAALQNGALVWALALVLVGNRTVHGWSWPRAAAATLLPAAPVALALARAYGLL